MARSVENKTCGPFLKGSSYIIYVYQARLFKFKILLFTESVPSGPGILRGFHFV